MKWTTWTQGNGKVCIYTENPNEARVLKTFNRDYTTYQRQGTVFGWQFLIPKSKLSFIENEIARIGSIELE